MDPSPRRRRHSQASVRPLILALDQGTSSTRCVVLDDRVRTLGQARVRVASSFPAPGRVEQNADELAASAAIAIRSALADSNRGWDEIACLSIAAQTETFVLWERDTGNAVSAAVGWQDHRTSRACAALRREGKEAFVQRLTGLPLNPTFPASKVSEVLDSLAMPADELCYGDVACWLVHRLSGGAVHVTDVANASRSSLLDLATLEWSPALLDLFGVPAAILPRIVSSDATPSVTASSLGGEAPIVGVMGDQQASLFGQGGWQPGTAKLTLGTGAFLWLNAGDTPPAAANGVVATCAWRRRGVPTYAYEAVVPAAGSCLDWLLAVGLLPSIRELEPMLEQAAGNGVAAVPALAGLGTPTWATDVTGALFGLTLGSDRSDLVSAVVDGILHQVADAVAALTELRPIDSLRVDGGLARSGRILQRLADLTGLPINRSPHDETTAIGVAMLGGRERGIWCDDAELDAHLTPDLRCEPLLPAERRKDERRRWSHALETARSWSA